MFTLLAVRLLILHAFSLFFLFFFSLSMFPLLRFASRYVYLLSLYCASSVDSFFFENSLLFIFLLFSKKKRPPFSFVHPFFVKLFLCHLLCCFAPFPVCFCFFQSCSFEQDKLTFFFWQKNHLFNTSKNLSSEFLLFVFLKSLSSFFFDFFEVPFFKKTFFFLNFSENST